MSLILVWAQSWPVLDGILRGIHFENVALSPAEGMGLFPCSCLKHAEFCCFIAPRVNGTVKGERRRDLGGYESSSTLMSSELETTSFFDSDEDDSTSRYENLGPGRTQASHHLSALRCHCRA